MKKEKTPNKESKLINERLLKLEAAVTRLTGEVEKLKDARS